MIYLEYGIWWGLAIGLSAGMIALSIVVATRFFRMVSK